jgi:hypothetical protein
MVIAIALLAMALLAGPAAANVREIHVQYFSDSQLNYMNGESVDWCDDSTSNWGTLAGDYIGHYEVSCSTGAVSNVSCYHWNGSNYDSVDCYWDGLDGRIHIPVGGH